MSVQFQELTELYQERFGEPSPVHDLGMYPTPAEAEAMLERALERGTPITDEDYPSLGEGRVV